MISQLKHTAENHFPDLSLIILTGKDKAMSQ